MDSVGGWKLQNICDWVDLFYDREGTNKSGTYLFRAQPHLDVPRRAPHPLTWLIQDGFLQPGVRLDFMATDGSRSPGTSD